MVLIAIWSTDCGSKGILIRLWTLLFEVTGFDLNPALTPSENGPSLVWPFVWSHSQPSKTLNLQPPLVTFWQLETRQIKRK